MPPEIPSNDALLQTISKWLCNKSSDEQVRLLKLARSKGPEMRKKISQPGKRSAGENSATAGRSENKNANEACCCGRKK